MPARRIPGRSGTTPGPSVTFTFDGREYRGVEGEPLAVSLLAAGHPILSRSFRFHRPRGLMCSTGGCGWCECEVDGVPSVRSCRAPVREGLVARGEHAWPSVERDLLSLVGLASRWIPPTFYHHRFLRPRRLRKRYLDVLRWFGGRGRLRPGERTPPPGRPVRQVEIDVLVVGGGRAGMQAALEAAGGGARVILVEAASELGGWRRLAGGPDTAELAARTRDAGVEILTGTVAAGWYGDTVAAIGDNAHLEIRAGSIVAATGSYDRVPLVAGNDRPGVMAARTVLRLLARHGVLPGERALLVGEGEDLARAREELGSAGATCLAPIPTAALLSVRGGDRVTGATIETGGQRRHVAVDLVVFADRSPNLDLVLAAGAVVGRQGDALVPVIDGSGRTSVASLSVVGSAAGRPVEPTDPGWRAASDPSDGASVARGAMVCFCEDVRAWEIRAEQAAGYTDPELIKRRTGTLTGPCQGKYCLQSFACLAGVSSDGTAVMPNARPPLRPIRLGDLVAAPTDPDDRRERPS